MHEPLRLEIVLKDGTGRPIPDELRPAFASLELRTRFMIACDLGITGMEYPVRVPGVGIIRVRATAL